MGLSKNAIVDIIITLNAYANAHVRVCEIQRNRNETTI